MTIAELIKRLKDLPQGAPVYSFFDSMAGPLKPEEVFYASEGVLVIGFSLDEQDWDSWVAERGGFEL